MSSWVRWGSRFGALIPFVSAVHAAPPVPVAYVLGANDARVVRVDLATGTVVPDVARAGSFPNRIETGPREELAVLVSSGSDEITFLDLDREVVLGTVLLPAGSNPWTAEVVDGRALVSCLLTDKLYAVELSSLSVTDSASTGRAPQGIAVLGERIYVANTGFDFGTFSYEPGTVTVLAARDLSLLATIPVSLNPQDCRVMADGTVHVVCTGDFAATHGSVDVIDPRRGEVVARMAVPSSYPGTIVSTETTAYLGVTTLSFGAEIRSYDVATLAPEHDESDPLLPSLGFYGEIAIGPGGALLVPDFTRDLLLVEDPARPGSPAAHSVSDGPIDVAFRFREPPRSPERDRGAPAPRAVSIAAIRPNPSRGAVSFEVSAPPGSRPAATIHDVHGRVVARLQSRPAGSAVLLWDGRDTTGDLAAPGVYMLRAEAGGRSATRRIVRVR